MIEPYTDEEINLIQGILANYNVRLEKSKFGGIYVLGSKVVKKIDGCIVRPERFCRLTTGNGQFSMSTTAWHWGWSDTETFRQELEEVWAVLNALRTAVPRCVAD